MAMRTIGARLRMETGEYVAGARTAGVATDQLTGKMERTSATGKRSFSEMAHAATLVGVALIGVATVAVVAAAKFDKTMSEVGAVANATDKELRELRDAALEAGAATSFSASQAAQAEAELAKAGVKTADILGGGLQGALSLAAAGTLDLATAATIAANAMNTFALSGEDVEHIADVLAAAANKSAASVEDLGLGLQQVGLVAAQVGFSLEETVGLLAAFADRGLRGSDGATSLKTALLRLAAPEAEAAKLMKQLGISMYDMNGNMIGAVELAGQLRKALGDMSPAQRNAALQTIFGSDAIRAANVLYAEGEDGIRDYIDAVNDEGAASEVAAKKLDNLAGDVEALTGSLETLFIKSGSGASEGLRVIVQGLTAVTNAFGSLPDSVQTATVTIAALTGIALLGAAAYIKTAAAVRTMNLSLLATGPAGAKAAGALGLVSKAALPLTAAFLAIDYAADKMGYSFEKTGHLRISQSFFDDLNKGFGGLADNAEDAAAAVDQALSDMVTSGSAAQAIDTVRDAAAAAGMSFQAALVSLPKFAAALGGAANVTTDQAEAAGDAARQNIRMAGAFGEAANEVDGLTKAFERFNGAVLKWRDAERSAEAAVDDLQKALDESNGSLDVHDEEGRAAAAAVDELAQSAIEAAQAKYDETGSVEQANAVYQDYIQQLRQTLINAGMAADEVDALIASIAAVPEYKAVTIEVRETRSVYWQEYRAGERNRYGGIYEHAAVGTLREAGIYSPMSPGRYMIAEPETGGEAFVPLKGNYGRSMSILNQAASHYGAQVVPQGGWYGDQAQAQAVDVRLSFSGVSDSALMQAITDGLRVDVTNSGGTPTVQGAYGRRGRMSGG